VITSLGIDLGQSRDYSAIATVADDGDVWTLSALERLPLGMPYTEIVKRIIRLEQSARPRYLVVDAGGPAGRLPTRSLRRCGLSCARSHSTAT
jgi:hypothetical protein